MKEKKTVLICEDDVSLNKQISQSIEDRCLNNDIDVEVFSAHTLNQSLDFINLRYFSLILIDLNLGGQLPKSWKDSEGIIIIERLREKNFGTKMFVSSANPETDLVFDLVKKYSIDNYIAKGANVNSYPVLIDSIIDSLLSTEAPAPHSHSEAFLGTHGSEAYLVEYSFARSIGVFHTDIEFVFEIISKYTYPYFYKRPDDLIINEAFGYVKAIFWSYKLGCDVGLLIQKDTKNIQDPSQMFYSSTLVVSETILGARIDILKIAERTF